MFPNKVRLRVKLNQVMAHYFRSAALVGCVTRALGSNMFDVSVGGKHVVFNSIDISGKHGNDYQDYEHLLEVI